MANGEEQKGKAVYEVKVLGAEEAAQAFDNIGASAAGLKDQLGALKEEPLEVAPPAVAPEEEEEEKKEEKKPLLPRKKLKAEEEAAVKRVSGMLSSGLVQGLKSGDVKGALENMGTQLATTAATSAINMALQSALSFIPGIGPLLGGLFGGLFQREGLVKSPTLALVGEREPEFIMTQERMRGLLRGGKPGYGFGPGDFGMTNVNVAPPNVSVEVSVAPGVDADIQTAYRARAGEARLSQLEG
ncbi:MAG: hypothetical protein GTN49_03445 [candidate division Zixibacteria bacterium]|nr:hypothetical protein [candidate division Zixibacteria bacterium]